MDNKEVAEQRSSDRSRKVTNGNMACAQIKETTLDKREIDEQWSLSSSKE